MILPAKPFYLMRHGETVTNAQGLMMGGAEHDLNEVGVEQAQATAEWISK